MRRIIFVLIASVLLTGCGEVPQQDIGTVEDTEQVGNDNPQEVIEVEELEEAESNTGKIENTITYDLAELEREKIKAEALFNEEGLVAAFKYANEEAPKDMKNELNKAIGILNIKLEKEQRDRIEELKAELIQMHKDGKVNESVDFIEKTVEKLEQEGYPGDLTIELIRFNGDLIEQGMKEIAETYGLTLDDLKPLVSIVNAKQVDDKIEITVRNDSEYTLKYIEVDIFYKDADNNTLHSHYTNWSGTLNPGAQCILDTYAEAPQGAVSYEVSVSDYSVK